jgi:hypothetical protein
LSLLTEAANLDPAWPYPIYDRAFTHLLKGEIDEALRDYERTVELSPRGFYVAAQAIDMLRHEATGELPEGLFVALVTRSQRLGSASCVDIAASELPA